MIGVITIIYLAIATIPMIYGVIQMILFSEYGRDDEGFQLGVTCVKYAIIWPYLIYKIIKTRLDKADGGEQ